MKKRERSKYMKEYREQPWFKEKQRVYMKEYMRNRRAKQLTDRLEQQRINPSDIVIVKKCKTQQYNLRNV